MTPHGLYQLFRRLDEAGRWRIYVSWMKGMGYTTWLPGWSKCAPLWLSGREIQQFQHMVQMAQELLEKEFPLVELELLNIFNNEWNGKGG